MKKADRNAELLDRWLDQIQREQAGLEDLLKDSTEQAGELAALLRTAALASQSLSPAGPSKTFRKASRIRVEKRMRERLSASRPAGRAPRRAMWHPARSLASLLIALGLLAATVGGAYASTEALPGGPLYGLKVGLEQASLVISPTAAGDTDLLLRFAQRRLDEAQELISLGREADLELALEGYQRAVEGALATALPDAASAERVGAALDANETALLRVLAGAPDKAKPKISEALEKSREAKNRLDRGEQGSDPDRVPPGQLKKNPGAEPQADKPARDKTKTPKPRSTATPTS